MPQGRQAETTASTERKGPLGSRQGHGLGGLGDRWPGRPCWEKQPQCPLPRVDASAQGRHLIPGRLFHWLAVAQEVACWGRPCPTQQWFSNILVSGPLSLKSERIPKRFVTI